MTSSELMDKSQEETFQVLPSYKKKYVLNILFQLAKTTSKNESGSYAAHESQRCLRLRL